MIDIDNQSIVLNQNIVRDSQLAYIIENNILHFGADSLCVHLSSYFNKLIVSLYSIDENKK
jgi:ADP-heptose:LPS heptosyltransferase